MVTAANQTEDNTPPQEVLAMVDRRQTARSDKNWSESDRLRDEIESLGWQVQDTPEGAKLVKG
jgi:cysteinyl-tRNA synthetase